MTKSEALLALQEEMTKNTTLPLQESNLVFGEGDPEAEIVFIGEAPGAHEDREKRPFVGRSGQLLRNTLKKIGWKEEAVYITNIVKRRPPENRDPLPEEIEAYKPYLARQLEIIAPAIIVTLGRFSMNYFLPEGKITRDQGKAFRLGDQVIVPIFHPAAALRSTEVLKTFEASLIRLPEIIKKMKALKESVPPKQPPTPVSSKKQTGLF